MRSVLVIIAAWTPALAAVAVGSVTGLGWDHALRMVVIALVYAPVSAIVLGIRQRTVAAVTAGLAVSSGATALVMVLRRAPELTRLLAPVEQFGVAAMHLSELAALGILIWMLGPRGRRTPGLVMGGIAILCDVGLVVLRFTGAEIGALQFLPLGLALLSFFVGATVTVGRWVQTVGIPRIVLVWFAVGATLLLSSYALVLPNASSVVLSLGTASFILAQSLLPTAILAAVFGGAGAVISRKLVTGMVWAQALASAIGLYVVTDGVARAFGAGELLAGGLAAALLALTFSIMLGVFRELTGLIFFGPGSSMRHVLSQLGSRLSNGGSGDGLQGLAEALREIWHLSSVTVLLGTPGVDGMAAERGSWVELVCVGDPGPAAIEHELRVAGGANGRILCTADDRAVLTNIVEPMLEQISGFVAISVQLALAGRDLAALRDRTRGVRREERRVLHRELHDELAPALAGIGFALAGARRMLAIETAAHATQAARESRASAAIAEVQEELAETAERTRRLARALLPAALDAGDLEGALHELAGRFTTTDCRVTVGAPGSDRLGNEAQITVYLVLAETVEVVTREAPGITLHLELQLDEGTDSPQGCMTVRMRCDPLPVAAAERVAESIARRSSEAGGSFESALDEGRGTMVLPK